MWMYVSSRKYGFVDTMSFVVVLPFFFINASLLLLIPSSEQTNDKKYKTFIDDASMVIMTTINDSYEGSITDTHVADEQVYITIKFPFGLSVPIAEMMPTIADKLHVSSNNILIDSISENKSYVIFKPVAFGEYQVYRKNKKTIETFSDIWKRIILA